MRVWVAQLGLNERLLCTPVLRPYHVVRHAPHDVKYDVSMVISTAHCGPPQQRDTVDM